MVAASANLWTLSHLRQLYQVKVIQPVLGWRLDNRTILAMIKSKVVPGHDEFVELIFPERVPRKRLAITLLSTLDPLLH